MNPIIEVVSPVLFTALIGFIFNYFMKLNLKVLARVYIYLLTPALIFQAIYDTQLQATTALKISASILLLTTILWLFSFLFCKLFFPEKNTALAMQMGIIFMNVGNYGLPLVFFAFGQEGLEIGVIFVLLSSILHFSLGIAMASDKKDFKEGLKTIFKLPIPYAAILALFIRLMPFALPSNIILSIDFISAAALPLAVIIMGMQLTQARFKAYLPHISVNLFFRLILSPLFAFVITKAFGFSALIAGVLVLQAATPSSVNSVIIATEYQREPALVSSLNLTSTIGSLITIPILLYLLL